MSSHKPLPALPTAPDLTTLSVEARTHRARLIKHFLNDLHEPGIDARRDGWVFVFEEVLDDLGQHISQGDWLSSIKRGKALKWKPTNKEHTKALVAEIPKEADSKNGSKVIAQSNDTKPLPDEPEPPLPPLKQLRSLVSRPTLPLGESRVGHLLLCLAPYGSRPPLPTEDSGFDIVPANIGCIFSPGTFSLQDAAPDEVGTILYGLDGVEANKLDGRTRLVGGTFAFKGVNSPLQHHLLFKALKLGLYAHLSLILEQHFLYDSGIHIKYPRPKFPPQSPSTPSKTPPESPSKEVNEFKIKARNSIIPSSFTNIFFKRNLSYRGAQTIGAASRGASLDLATLPSPSDRTMEIEPQKSPEAAESPFSALRLRRFSFLADRRHSFMRGHPFSPEKQVTAPPQPFRNALRRIEESKDLLSTSTGVTLALPKLIVALADKETLKQSQSEIDGQKLNTRLKGDEKIALTSLLGWSGKEAEGRGMSGILGFVRQQEISVLCSSHTPPLSTSTNISPRPPPPPITSNPSTSSSSDLPPPQLSSNFSTTSTNNTISSTTPSNCPTAGLSSCGKPHWVTYRYFSFSSNEDHTLGDWILEFAKERKAVCSRPGCPFVRGQHEQRVIHDGVRIVIRVVEEHLEHTGHGIDEKGDEKTHEVDHKILVWESCAVCDIKSPKRSMSDGSFLFSYAKFLELLVYSLTICNLTPALCEHTTPNQGSGPGLPSSRLNIIRHFSTASADVTFALSTIEDIFELRVPRLQITRGVEKVSPPPTSSGRTEASGTVDQKKLLRREIRKWWEGVSDHIDEIEKILQADDSVQKALPRLPSYDDAYEVFGESDASSFKSATTPTPSTPFPLPPLPPTTPHSPSKDGPQDSYFTTLSNISTDTQASKTPTVPPKDNSQQFLGTLRHNFQRIEQSLYAQLAKTPETSLNDVRRSFIATGKGTQKRLKAWQAKHLGPAKSKVIGDLEVEEPEWWGNGCHAVPGGNIIVRENDWGSIIAHTLSTMDYQLEMANFSIIRSGSQSNTTPVSPSEPPASSSFFSVATGYRLFTSSSKNQPDPDQEHVVWNEPEQYSAVISRKEHGRDATSLLSIRNVLQQKPIHEQPTGIASGSRFISLSSATAAQAANGSPTAVKAKADVALNTEAAGGVVKGSVSKETADKVLQGLENEATPTTSRPASIRSEANSSSSGFVEAHIRRGKASSIISAESEDSQMTVGKDDDAMTSASQTSSLPPTLPPKEPTPITEKENPIVADNPPNSTLKITEPVSVALPPPTSSGFANALVTGVNSAMRYVLSSEPPPRAMSPPLNTKHHGLLLAEMSNIDERPHIKYDWTIGKRIKFSCTVYYARQFDLLRKRCGISDIFLKSLSRSTNWSAEGGKSKSNFWKTSDDRFIIKTLVNAWNVADLQVLIELAPSYFRYMDATASKPTVLAKLIGFYTVEIRNLETGAVQSKADLLVMENLFFDQNISKTFDLKGIQGRKVKTQGNTKTLFDGEWIEGQQRTLTLVRPYSKAILRDAIKSDAEFLSKSNIMDYSLLLGVDEDKKEIACGLVDTIGSYTFAKTLEYKAKHGLQSGKEVTVMPPAEYQERFVNALEGYFVACPDKWSKPLDESKVISDPHLLPSVL